LGRVPKSQQPKNNQYVRGLAPSLEQASVGASSHLVTVHHSAPKGGEDNTPIHTTG
jgi:hypothetical protein